MSKRQRLTITLKQDLIKRLDETIDDNNVRNRSHAIELILNEKFRPKIQKAVILTGWQNSKIKFQNHSIPQALLNVKGRSLLEYTIDLFREYGLKDIVIVVDPNGDKIKKYFQNGSKFNLHISYIEEKKPSGSAGALLQARDLLDETFFLIYGDVLADINLANLADFHQQHRGLVTMALTAAENTSDWGVVKLNGSKIETIIEKPNKSMHLSGLINSGIFIIEPEVINLISRDKKAINFETDIFPKLAIENKLFGYPFGGQWYDISTSKVYEKVQKEWQK